MKKLAVRLAQIWLFSFAVTVTALPWAERMQQLGTAYRDVFAFVIGPAAAMNSAERSALQQIAELSADVEGHMATKPRIPIDPSLLEVAHLLKFYAKAAAQSAAAGDYAFTRRYLKAGIATCIACHTSGAGLRPFPRADFDPVFERANWLTQAEIEAAFGQFESLQNRVHAAFDDGRENVSDRDLEKAARLGLTAAVRTATDLDGASDFLAFLDRSPRLTPFLRVSLAVWREDLAVIRSVEDTNMDGEQKAGRLLESYSENGIASVSPRHDLLYLWVSRVLHDFLRQNPVSPKRADAYYYLGLSYEGLRELGLWSLHETYYEACIRSAPHTPRARLCLQRYTNSVLEMSGHPHDRPDFLQNHLEELTALSR